MIYQKKRKKKILQVFLQIKFYYLLTISDFLNLNCLQIQMSYNKLWKNQKDFRNNIIHYLLHRVYKKNLDKTLNKNLMCYNKKSSYKHIF